MWDRQVAENVEDDARIYSLSCKFRTVTNKFELIFTRVYGPHQDSERGFFRKELGGLVNWWDAPW